MRVLKVEDIAFFVRGMPQDILEATLHNRRRGVEVTITPEKKLKAILADPKTKIPRWMRNPVHHHLAERLVASALWEGTGRKRQLTLKIVRGHFRDTDTTHARGPQQYERRYKRTFVPKQ